MLLCEYSILLCVFEGNIYLILNFTLKSSSVSDNILVRVVSNNEILFIKEVKRVQKASCKSSGK